MTDPDSPPAAPPAPPPAPAPAPAPEASAVSLTTDEEAQLGALMAKRDAAAAAGSIVRMKVSGPDGTTLTHGGVTVGTEYTDVPAGFAAAMMTAADDAGMEIEQEVS